ncbi:glycoside hydrolase family 76 protein [Favolaschia claudopus]|uniref:Glycoside hydrolase family 76 protein n=1 Tax=Favolaschia claudopus TaxID=2862362 RepID=A0AAW0AP48_9AGAR
MPRSPLSSPIPVPRTKDLSAPLTRFDSSRKSKTPNTASDTSDDDLSSQSPALDRAEFRLLRLVRLREQRIGNKPSSFSGSERSRRSSGYSSDGRGSAWMSGFSDAASDQSSPRSSPTSNTPQFLPSFEVDSQSSGLSQLNLTGRVAKLGQYPFESGRTADIYRASMVSLHAPEFKARRSQGTQHVAVKIFRRMHYEPGAIEQMSKVLYSEALIWRRLDHPNVLPFLGISLDLGPSPALISPLCTSGSVMKYLKENAKDMRDKLQLTIDVAHGLQYLHSEDIVHGNLCTKKILVNDEGSPMICGYGMSRTLGTTSDTTSLLSTSVRFTPPECFLVNDDTHHIRTQSADVYAFSMVVLEILSGLEPYHHLPTEHAVVAHIVRGGQPIRSHLDGQAVNASLWQFLTSLWTDKPHARPRISEIIGRLTKIQHAASTRAEEDPSMEVTIFSVGCTDDKGSSGEEIFFGHYTLPEIPGRDLKGRITQDDQYPFAGGGNSNVYRGKLTRSDGRKIRVAIKMFRISDDGSGQLDDIVRRLKREVEVWSKLKHKNILPFIGVCDDLAPTPVLISPFYKFGHVGTYLRKHPHMNRMDIVNGVACGLQFLHDNEVIHGDLKLHNVLIDKHGTPCICDFGISKIVNRHGFTTASVGTAPYMAPELFLVIDRDGTEAKQPTTTKKTDIYSFGLLILEIMISRPLEERPSRPIITLKVLENLHPKRIHYASETIPDEMWNILDQCWASEAEIRPSIHEIMVSALFSW